MAKAASKSTKSKTAKKPSAKHRVRRQSYSTYISRVLRHSTKTPMTLSAKSMRILNSMVLDFFDRLATQGAALARMNKKSTLGSREIQTAVRLTLPAELAKHALAEGTRAVAKASA